MDLNYLYKLFLFGLLLFFGFAITNNFYKLFNLKIFFKQHNSVQNIVRENIPRLGGAFIYLSIFLFYFINYSFDFVSLMLISYLLIFIVSFAEDLYFNVKPLLRLCSIFVCALIFLYFSNINLTLINIPFKYLFNDNFLLFLFFYAICISALTNGMNIIDGTNGLTVISFSFSIFFLLLLAIEFNNFTFLNFYLLLLISSIIFILFNFPLGKIFLGDCGAYFFGYTLSIVVIIFYIQNNHLSSYGAILLIFYPIMEVLFSYLRKLILRTSPFQPDGKHLHLMIFNFLSKKFKNDKLANNLTTICLLPLAISGPIIFYYFFDNSFVIIPSIIFLVFLYFLYYIFFNFYINDHQ